VKWPPWRKSEHSEEIARAQERLEKVYSDDAKVNDLSRRARKIVHENELAPAIMKALGVRN